MKHEFEIEVMDDPQALLRVMGLFPQRDLTIDSLNAERRDGQYRLSIACTVPPPMASTITAKLQQLVLVTHASSQPASHQ